MMNNLHCSQFLQCCSPKYVALYALAYRKNSHMKVHTHSHAHTHQSTTQLSLKINPRLESTEDVFASVLA